MYKPYTFLNGIHSFLYPQQHRDLTWTYGVTARVIPGFFFFCLFAGIGSDYCIGNFKILLEAVWRGWRVGTEGSNGKSRAVVLYTLDIIYIVSWLCEIALLVWPIIYNATTNSRPHILRHHWQRMLPRVNDLSGDKSKNHNMWGKKQRHSLWFPNSRRAGFNWDQLHRAKLRSMHKSYSKAKIWLIHIITNFLTP